MMASLYKWTNSAHAESSLAERRWRRVARVSPRSGGIAAVYGMVSEIWREFFWVESRNCWRLLVHGSDSREDRRPIRGRELCEIMCWHERRYF